MISKIEFERYFQYHRNGGTSVYTLTAYFEGVNSLFLHVQFLISHRFRPNTSLIRPCTP